MTKLKYAAILVICPVLIVVAASCTSKATEPEDARGRGGSAPGQIAAPTSAPTVLSTTTTPTVTPALPTVTPIATLAITTAPTPAITAAPTPATPATLLEATPYVNNDFGFSMRPPRGWTRDDSGKANTLIFFANPRPDTDGGYSFIANINIVMDSIRGRDFNSYIQYTRQFLTSQTPGAKIVSEKNVTLGTDNGHLFEWTWTAPQSRSPLRLLMLLRHCQIISIAI